MNGALGGRKRARASRRALVDGAAMTVGEHRDLIARARETEKSIRLRSLQKVGRRARRGVTPAPALHAQVGTKRERTLEAPSSSR